MHILHGGLPGISWISWAPKVKRDSQDMETQGAQSPPEGQDGSKPARTNDGGSVLSPTLRGKDEVRRRWPQPLVLGNRCMMFLFLHDVFFFTFQN